METKNISFVVDYVLKDASTDFYEKECRRFFDNQYDVGAFLKEFEDPANVYKLKHPKVYFCTMDLMPDNTVQLLIDGWQLLNKRRAEKKEQLRHHALSKLTDEEKEILGI